MNNLGFNKTELTGDLLGQEFEWTYSSGMKGRVAFTAEIANWEILEGPNKGETGSNNYKARSVGEGIYFVQWYEPEFNILVTLLINKNRNEVLSSIYTPNEIEFDFGKIHTK